MFHKTQASARRAALVLPLALFLAAPAWAGGDKGERRILLHDDEMVLARRNPLANFELAKKHGIAYRTELRLGGHPVTLKVTGPVHKKGLGVGFKIKF